MRSSLLWQLKLPEMNYNKYAYTQNYYINLKNYLHLIPESSFEEIDAPEVENTPFSS